LVLTVVADDRPGLVDAISGVIEEHGGNWERSQMARLGGKFAGIVQVSVPDGAADALQASLAELTHLGLMHVSAEPTGVEVPTHGHRFVLTMVGTDRPGLVHSVSASLAAVGASIEELTTDTKSAPMSGGQLFEATATVVLPATLGIDAVRNELEALADRLMVDIELTD
jgi:glycine cleavage system regulatory protein